MCTLSISTLLADQNQTAKPHLERHCCSISCCSCYLAVRRTPIARVTESASRACAFRRRKAQFRKPLRLFVKSQLRVRGVWLVRSSRLSIAVGVHKPGPEFCDDASVFRFVRQALSLKLNFVWRQTASGSQAVLPSTKGPLL